MTIRALTLHANQFSNATFESISDKRNYDREKQKCIAHWNSQIKNADNPQPYSATIVSLDKSNEGSSDYPLSSTAYQRLKSNIEASGFRVEEEVSNIRNPLRKDRTITVFLPPPDDLREPSTSFKERSPSPDWPSAASIIEQLPNAETIRVRDEQLIYEKIVELNNAKPDTSIRSHQCIIRGGSSLEQNRRVAERVATCLQNNKFTTKQSVFGSFVSIEYIAPT